jgi:hypothetical protein
VAGQTFDFKKVGYFRDGLSLRLTSPYIIFLFLPKDSRDEASVGDFNRTFNSALSIVFDAPYVDPY